jgi:hypothetical protein
MIFMVQTIDEERDSEVELAEVRPATTHTTDRAASKPGRETISISTKPLVVAVLAVLVAIGGFVGGMQYQKGKSTIASSATAGLAGQGGATAGGFGGRGGGQALNGGFGTVTAVSDSSITISDRRTSGTKTYSISSSTTITDAGAAATVSSIATGDQVLVRTSSSTSTAATTIEVNPTMQGGPAGQSSSSSSTGSST